MRTSIHPDEKRQIYEAARATMLQWYGASLATRGACLYWNQCAMRELLLRGYRAVLQAGDLLWRIVPAAQDDGQRATHFGYEWSPYEPFSVHAVAQGLLPEVHIWCGLPETGDCVDFSTFYLPEIAKNDHGFDWHTEKPPLYVFGQPPADAVYRPRMEAIRFVWGFIIQKMATEAQREKLQGVLA